MHITKESTMNGKKTCYGNEHTEKLIQQISDWNTYLSPVQVAIHLEAGSTIYTTFNKYYKV